MLIVSPTLAVPESELELRFARSSGPGGQNVNKVNSKALLRWRFAGSALPAGIKERFRAAFGARITKEGDVIVVSDRFRDQKRNLEDCRRKLAAMLASVAEPPRKRRKTKPTPASRERRHLRKRRQGEKKKSRRVSGWDD